MSIHATRIRDLNGMPENSRGRYVLYWMQQSQRVQYNPALFFAIQRANDLGLPLLVVFGLMADYPEANMRHYAFMLEGLAEVQQALRRKGIAFCMDMGSPAEVAVKHSRGAALLVCDKGYLRHQRQWRARVAADAGCTVMEVEGDVVVPVQVVSCKAEYAARTIRPRIRRELASYQRALPSPVLRCKDPDLTDSVDFSALENRIRTDRAIGPVPQFFKGGRRAALEKLTGFIESVLDDYDRLRNRPELDASAMLSPYLHFGQISPLEIALAVEKAGAPAEARQAFIEELIVRRELAINHVYYNDRYDQYAGLPDWCRRTLGAHGMDRREPVYSERELMDAETHDPYWNAAMKEMTHTGFMHSYMRMYWGKKILQWTPAPEQAFEIMLRLNNAFFVDGRDPNSYAGVGWVFGLHDRPWKERAIYGQIRYMACSGLERKFDMQGYVDKVNRRVALG